ncbi:hypothetical protein EVA_11717 [gut metagenome]|uniref:Uncharacterized protein n=1 Tax=gut metagenome TaxID=749906 RepID=J9CJE1_9ZZZZ
MGLTTTNAKLYFLHFSISGVVMVMCPTMNRARIFWKGNFVRVLLLPSSTVSCK